MIIVSKGSRPRFSSGPWGFEFLRAYISVDGCWIYYALTHNSMYLDIGSEALKLICLRTGILRTDRGAERVRPREGASQCVCIYIYIYIHIHNNIANNDNDNDNKHNHKTNIYIYIY